MDEPIRWVTKPEAAQEVKISLSTLDRRVRKGEVALRREGHCVYIGRTVRRLELSASDWKHRASERERARDEAGEAASASRLSQLELERKCREPVDEHEMTIRAFSIVRIIALLLLALLMGSVLLWWFVLS